MSLDLLLVAFADRAWYDGERFSRMLLCLQKGTQRIWLADRRSCATHLADLAALSTGLDAEDTHAMMQIQNALSIKQLALAHFHNPEVVQAIIHQIVLLMSAGERRLALNTLVEQLITADELEQAVSVARLTPALTPHAFVNDVDYWLKGELLLAIVDRLLDQQRVPRALQLLDEAALGLQDLQRYDSFDMPHEPPWLQLTRRYARADALARIEQIWDLAIAYARTLEQSLAVPDPHFFQPEDGSRFLAGIAEDMARLGQHERAQAVANAIANDPHRTWALARVQALMAAPPSEDAIPPIS